MKPHKCIPAEVNETMWAGDAFYHVPAGFEPRCEVCGRFMSFGAFAAWVRSYYRRRDEAARKRLTDGVPA